MAIFVLKTFVLKTPGYRIRENELNIDSKTSRDHLLI